MKLADELGFAIDRALTSRRTEPRFRVFKNGALDYRACAAVARHWKVDGGRPDEQLERIAGPGAVLAVNDIASWNDAIRLSLATDTRTLPPSISGKTMRTSDVYAFVSTSEGWTAFGAHVDFEYSIIIDLYGAGRDVLTWPAGSNYGQRMDGAKSFFGISFDWEEYIESSTRERISPGDVAVVSPRQPHIFHANGSGFFLGLSTEETNGSDSDCSLSDLAKGPAFIPKNDVTLAQSVWADADPPRVRFVDGELAQVNQRRLSYGNSSIVLSTDEYNLIQSDSLEAVVRQYQSNATAIVRSIVAKLLMIGAVVVYSDSKK